MKRGRNQWAWAVGLLLSAMFAQAAPAETPERAQTLVVYGDDPCPTTNSDEIIVCARKPESERYRIPKDLRHADEPLTAHSWANQVDSLDDAAREARPNSCSVVGTGGQTGCFQQMISQWLAERRSVKP